MEDQGVGVTGPASTDICRLKQKSHAGYSGRNCVGSKKVSHYNPSARAICIRDLRP
jgi:hypothetical protein